MLHEDFPLKVVKQVYYALVEFIYWRGTYTSTIKLLIFEQNYLIKVMVKKCRIESSWSLCT